MSVSRTREGITPLQESDRKEVLALLDHIFDESEVQLIREIWAKRRPDASLGIWHTGKLVAAALVREHCLEYIAVGEACRGSGIGTQLLQAVLMISPALHLTPVNDSRVIAWYESQGFHLSKCSGDRKIYVHRPYWLRSSRQVPS